MNGHINVYKEDFLIWIYETLWNSY